MENLRNITPADAAARTSYARTGSFSAATDGFLEALASHLRSWLSDVESELARRQRSRVSA